jgi:hypothetical protein
MHFRSVLVAMMVIANSVEAGHRHCLSQNETSTIIEGYTDLITKTQANFNLTLATQLLASDYHSSSDGVDYVREEPVRQNFTPFHLRAHEALLWMLKLNKNSSNVRPWATQDPRLIPPSCVARVRDIHFKTGIHQPASLRSTVSKCDNAQHLSHLQGDHLAIPAQHDSIAH